MASSDAEAIAAGLAQVAHAIRRSTAINVATMISPEGTSRKDLEETADDLAAWIGGQALVKAQQDRKEDEEHREARRLGKPWPPTD